MAVDRAIDSTEFDSKLTTVADAIRTAGVSEGLDLRTGLISGLIGKHKAKGVLLSDKETGTLKIYFGKGAPLQVGTTFHWFLFVEGAA